MRPVRRHVLFLAALSAVNGCIDDDVRLDSYPQGRPEVCSGGSWVPVCGHFFWANFNGAQTICKNAGFATGIISSEVRPANHLS